MKLREVEKLHRRAMELADMGDRSNRAHPASYHKAFRFERRAAEALKDRRDLEPSRSILYRSAASLAFMIGDKAERTRLAKEGLAGNPPAEIAKELREVMRRRAPWLPLRLRQRPRLIRTSNQRKFQ